MHAVDDPLPALGAGGAVALVAGDVADVNVLQSLLIGMEFPLAGNLIA